MRRETDVFAAGAIRSQRDNDVGRLQSLAQPGHVRAVAIKRHDAAGMGGRRVGVQHGVTFVFQSGHQQRALAQQFGGNVVEADPGQQF